MARGRGIFFLECLLQPIAVTAGVQQKLLVDNPMRLYWA